MPVTPCPSCGRPTPRLLDFTSQYARVNFYRCDCGHIWTTDKTDGSIVRHITPLPQPKAPMKK